MNILLLGDIVGRTGRKAVKDQLPVLIEEYRVDFVIANGENAAGGFGLTEQLADDLFSYGINVITMGNHTWSNSSIFSFIDNEKRLIRPLNYNKDTPGKGWTVLKYGNTNIAVINLIGQIFMNGNNSPFDEFDKNILEIKEKSDIIIIDFHAEATGEKLAFANYIDGQVSAVVGTHTHVQTSDEMILPNGTAYITDLGMCGAIDSILGMNKKNIIERFRTGIPERYIVKEGAYKIEG
ncbi:MAG: TIGR00282 family metallophosphoesterase, partial [Halanaerobiaceae bacterium]|nr:TIGR00282 family metallophosphoesterase [Halanaerobiaceae bacterium]